MVPRVWCHHVVRDQEFIPTYSSTEEYIAAAASIDTVIMVHPCLSLASLIYLNEFHCEALSVQAVGEPETIQVLLNVL